MTRICLIVGGVLGCLAVGCGAFGAQPNLANRLFAADIKHSGATLRSLSRDF